MAKEADKGKNGDKKKPPRLSKEEGKELAAVLQPKTFDEAYRLAELLERSDMVPKEYRDKPGDILIAMAHGANVGFHWTQALQSITVMDGKPTLYGDAGLALVERSGLAEEIKEWDDAGLDGGTAFFQIKRKGREARIFSYSMKEASQVQVYYYDNKDGQRKSYPLTSKITWKSFPRDMRMWRARWRGLHGAFADVLKGLRGREEIEEGVVTDDQPPPQAAIEALPMPERIDAEKPEIDSQEASPDADARDEQAAEPAQDAEKLEGEIADEIRALMTKDDLQVTRKMILKRIESIRDHTAILRLTKLYNERRKEIAGK